MTSCWRWLAVLWILGVAPVYADDCLDAINAAAGAFFGDRFPDPRRESSKPKKPKAQDESQKSKNSSAESGIRREPDRVEISFAARAAAERSEQLKRVEGLLRVSGLEQMRPAKVFEILINFEKEVAEGLRSKSAEERQDARYDDGRAREAREILRALGYIPETR